MDAATAFRVVRLVFAVTVRDGRVSDNERAFLDRVRAKLGLAAGSDAWVMPIVDAESAARELQSLSAELQHETIGLLIEAAAVDGAIHEAERTLLDAVAQAIGWAPASLEDRILRTLAATHVPKRGRLGPG